MSFTTRPVEPERQPTFWGWVNPSVGQDMAAPRGNRTRTSLPHLPTELSRLHLVNLHSRSTPQPNQITTPNSPDGHPATPLTALYKKFYR